MSAAPGTSSHDSSDSDRLNGWKEIASFLGKGVRTAQRWEKDYGLPIHRIGREGGEIIFASRVEITAWLERGGSARDNQHAGNPAANESSPRSDETIGRHRSSGRRAVWALGGAAAALVAGLAIWTALRPPSNPDQWRVERDRLQVYDDHEALLFAHRFDFQPDIEDLPFVHQSGGIGVVEDLDGDGVREVIFGARDRARGPSSGFYIFNAEGTVRREIRPAHVVTFGDEEYSAPWLPYRVFVNRRADGSPGMHLVFIHGRNYPSLLLEIDAEGNTLAEYWSNGYVESVEYLQWRGMEVLAIGASNNDTQGSSLALFESGRASGSAPAEKDSYRCVSCPPGDVLEPSAFVVFPRRCLHESINGTGVVGHVWTDAMGSFFVRVEEGDPTMEGLRESSVTYVLDANLGLSRVEPDWGFFAAHDAWYKRGAIDHPASVATDGPTFFPVRVWRESGFVDLPPAPVDWSQFDARANR